jgi:UDP-N-acetylmuramoyl-L-alanyl-D-glutamate--2,6-diaminopimelate ligase
VVVEPDRARAVALAVAAAAPGDVVLLAGRGADGVQVSVAGRRDFDDRVALRHALVARAAQDWDAPVAG